MARGKTAPQAALSDARGVPRDLAGQSGSETSAAAALATVASSSPAAGSNEPQQQQQQHSEQIKTRAFVHVDSSSGRGSVDQQHDSEVLRRGRDERPKPKPRGNPKLQESASPATAVVTDRAGSLTNEKENGRVGRSERKANSMEETGTVSAVETGNTEGHASSLDDPKSQPKQRYEGSRKKENPFNNPDPDEVMEHKMPGIPNGEWGRSRSRSVESDGSGDTEGPDVESPIELEAHGDTEFFRSSVSSSEVEYGGQKMHRTTSAGSELSWCSTFSSESNMDEMSQECRDFMKMYVEKVFKSE